MVLKKEDTHGERVTWGICLQSLLKILALQISHVDSTRSQVE